jgi:hypothetical protein
MWIQAFDDSRWAQEEADPPKSYEEACAKWAARTRQIGVGI